MRTMLVMTFAVATALGAMSASAATATSGQAIATFAGGCFWCMEHDMGAIPGVISVESGYTGGRNENPSYENHPGHFEAVRVRFDPKKVSYDALLDTYWHNVDFLDGGGQFCDRGTSYRPAIFVHDEAQKAAAEQSKTAAQKDFPEPIVTEIVPLKAFYAAESYHQNYYNLNKDRNPYCSVVITPKLQKLIQKGKLTEDQ